MLLAADRLLTPARTLAPGWLSVDGERVAEVGEGAPPAPPDDALGALTLTPGYVDAHCHGGGGASFQDGPGATTRAAATHLRHGTTSVVASLVSARHDVLLAQVAALAPRVDDGTLAGLHLEGPWLAPRHRGAHDPDVLADPDGGRVGELVEAGSGRLRMVTLAPELPGGLDAVRLLASAGVTVAVGHTDATYAQARAALEAGATVGTHLFNAMRPVHHREPGPVVALLEHPDTWVEVVADGVHLHPAAIRMAARDKPGRLVLVTDAMAAAGAGDGDYRLGGLEVRVRDGVARLASSDAIAGSTLTLDAAVRYAVHGVGLPLEDAVRAATATPAAMLGLDDVGSLAPGRRADLLVLDDDLAVRRVMRAGRWVA